MYCALSYDTGRRWQGTEADWAEDAKEVDGAERPLISHSQVILS